MWWHSFHFLLRNSRVSAIRQTKKVNIGPNNLTPLRQDIKGTAGCIRLACDLCFTFADCWWECTSYYYKSLMLLWAGTQLCCSIQIMFPKLVILWLACVSFAMFKNLRVSLLETTFLASLAIQQSHSTSSVLLIFGQLILYVLPETRMNQGDGHSLVLNNKCKFGENNGGHVWGNSVAIAIYTRTWN